MKKMLEKFLKICNRHNEHSPQSKPQLLLKHMNHCEGTRQERLPQSVTEGPLPNHLQDMERVSHIVHNGVEL